MVFRPPRFGALLLAAACVACGSSEPQDDTAQPSDAPDATSLAKSVAFNPTATLTLGTGEAKRLDVSVDPPGVHVVRFALLGESLSAMLDADERVTSSDGRTSVTLTAPVSATTFRLRAAAGAAESAAGGGSATAELAVSVSGEGFATVRVSPDYAGVRSTPTWTASAIARRLCLDVPSKPPNDGPIVGQQFGRAPVILKDLPVGPTIAITLRSAHAVGGCMDLPDLKTGETRDVAVNVGDVPVNAAATNLALAMTMTPDGSAAWAQIQVAENEFLDALLPPDSTEAKALLDAMQQHVTDTDSFIEARITGEWDSIVTTRLEQGGQLLREQVHAWVQKGFEPVRKGHTITGQLTATAKSTKHALLSVDTVFGLPRKALGMPRDHILSLTIEPADTMIIAGTLAALPSKLIAAGANAGLPKDHSTTPDAVKAIVDTVDCQLLADLLQASSPLPANCATTCMEAACESAVATIWLRATDHTTAAFDTIDLSFTVSGTAAVDGEAVVSSVDASWVGTQSLGDHEVAVRGQASAGVEAPHTD